MIDALHEREHYNLFYSEGGWSYSNEQQKQFLIEKIIEPLELAPGSTILEIGCGMGLHSRLLDELGFNVTGIDVSDVGIRSARRHCPGCEFYCMDLDRFISEERVYDVIYSRGMAWFHYELNTVNVHGIDVPFQTQRLFQMLKPGGLFILQISTDFTGSVAESGVYNNKLDEYTSFFEKFGDVVLVTNWNGEPLTDQAQAESLGRNILIATRKQNSLTHRNSLPDLV